MGKEEDEPGQAPVAQQPASESGSVERVELQSSHVVEGEEKLRGKDSNSGPVGDKEKQSEEDEDISALREWFELIVRAGFWALILYIFFFQVSVVDGPSMQPTFETNDRLVIDKVTYRFVAISRMDVVVFQAVDLDQPKSYRENKDYIKRVIGLPGEKVTLKNGKVFVDGVELKDSFGHTYPGPSDVDEFTVPPHHYFVMGDNRGNSKDSRAQGLGFVSEHQIRGLARLRFMPFSKFKWFWRGE